MDCPRLFRWCGIFGCLILTALATARAQQPESASTIPTLPEATVIGERQAPATEAFGPPSEREASAPGTTFSPEPVSGYRAGNSVTGLGVNAPNLDVPATVTVVPRDVISDQQALRLDDLLRNVPGAINDPSAITRFNQFTMRGFPLPLFELRRNGLVDLSLIPRELANIERVEFLQGPAAILYGGGQPGGVVNFITKFPQRQPAHSVEAQFGSFDLYRLATDSTGPLLGSDNWQYRNIVALQESKSFREFGFFDRVLAAPSVTWQLDEDTTLNAQFEYLYGKFFFDTGIVAPGGVVGVVPITRSFGEPGDFYREDDYRLALFLDHRFDDDWSFRLAGQSLWFPVEARRTLPVAFAPPTLGLPPTTVLRIKQDASAISEQYYTMLGYLAGTVSSGLFSHRLLFGSELGWLYQPDFQLRQSNPILTPLFLDALDPIYQNPAFGAPNPPLPFRNTIVQNQGRYGFIAQDLIDLTPRWKLLAGVRSDIVQNQFEQSSNVPLGFPVTSILPLATPRSTRVDATYYHWSPRVGLVFQPIPEGLAVYGSYSQSFDPVFGSKVDGQPLVPETGLQWEGGLKADLLDGILSFTAAGFFITKDNVAVPDPANDLFFLQVGQQRSQGTELSLIGNVTERWSLISNYAYLDTRNTQDTDPSIVGKPIRNVPYNSGAFWSRYNLLQSAERTLGAALGLVAVGERAGDLQDSFELPSYARWDAGLYYRRRHLSLSLYLENLFDVQYYVGSVSLLQVVPGAPFNVRGSLRWDF